MAHYINKDVLVVEIEKWISGWTERLNNTNPSNPSFFEGGIAVGKHILSFLNSLEVKEVDYDKEVTEYLKNFENANIGHRLSLRRCAWHFFTLGVNASNPLTWKDIADILDVTDAIANDDSMEERLKTMSEEEYCQEILKRFKDLKK